LRILINYLFRVAKEALILSASKMHTIYFISLILQGQQWINRVRLCLEDKLLHSSVYADNSSCDQISSFSYHTHPFCYVNNGFCNVVLMDKQNLNALFETVTVKDLTWPPEATRAICDTLKLCNVMDMNLQKNQSDVSKEDKFIPDFLTWIARLAADYPILTNVACYLYQ